jgi:hypothetical protein
VKSIALVSVLLTAFFSTSAFAQQIKIPNILKNGGLERPPSKLVCKEERQECEYLVVNAELEKMAQFLQTREFEGNVVTSSKEGYLAAEDNTLVFRVADTTEEGKARYERLKILVPSLDHFIVPSKKPWVRVTVKVFTITQESLRGFTAALKGISIGNPAEKKTGQFVSNEPADTIDISLGLGTVQASAVMRWGRSSSNIEQIDEYTQFKPINTSIGYEDLRHYEIGSPNNSQAKELKVGVEFGGKVGILSGEDSLVLIDGFGIDYSTAIGDPKTNGYQKMSFGGQLILYPGVETAIVTAKKALVVVEKRTGIAGIHRKRSTEERHLMVIFKAEPMAFQTMIDRTIVGDPKQFAIKFSPEELGLLSQAHLDTRGALENPIMYTDSTTTGDTIVGFMLDKKYASMENLNNPVKITIKGLAKDTIKDVRTLQSLMVGQGYRILKPLPIFDEPEINFKVELEDTKENYKVELPFVYRPFEGKIDRK